ncbi:MAG: carboxymuconolactone decarboxylase family protein [Hyphomicrobiaceae bacterium]|nr:carboxymuconolactone decarboxylase family protein [Hyphomicrobiaceae bacterium]
MADLGRIDLLGNMGNAVKAFEGVEQMLDASGLSTKLRHLLKLRASQMNGCAYCVEMHTREARADGETDTRLDHVVVWQEADCYSDAEHAMFAWTEALTNLDGTRNLDELHGELATHFSQAEIAAMTTQIAMINVWNRLQIASHGRRSVAGGKVSKAA